MDIFNKTVVLNRFAEIRQSNGQPAWRVGPWKRTDKNSILEEAGWSRRADLNR
jgi:hypothetical protein